jgi:glycosyltransferase involved in cell wall biosynthesis
VKVDVYTITYNEGKLLPYFLRHYESFADRIFAWDDGSDDGTREILDAHPKVKVLPHHLGKIDDIYFVQKLWPQYMQSRGYADFVICAESDEFVYHPNMLGKLEELQSEGIQKVCCKGFQMHHDKFPDTDGQIYDEAKFGSYDPKLSKTILFDPNVSMKWTAGRHHCAREKFSVYNTGISLLHYRLLGYDFYIQKMKKRLNRVSDPWHIYRKRTATTIEQFEEWGKDRVQVVY